MKVLYCGLKFDYGDKLRGYSFEHLNFYNTLKNMKSITRLDYICIDDSNRNQLNQNILDNCKTYNYDFVFFFLFKDEIFPETLNFIKKELSTPTVAWMADDHWRFETYSIKWAKYFTIVVTTDFNALEKYKLNKINNVILSQWACNHFSYKPVTNSNKGYGISFVGMSYGNRKKKINHLRNFHKIECWGNGWENKRLEFENMLDVYCNSKINLNFSESSYQKNLKTFIKIFLKKNSKFSYRPNNLENIKNNFSNFFKKTTKQIKGRVFEVPGCRGFLLTENSPYLDKYFEIDKELITFNSLDEAKDKINFYIKNYNLTKKISELGYLKVINEHTYEKRFLEIYKKINI